MNSKNIIPILLVGYVIWRVVRRIRRHIGPQPIRRGRMIFRIIFLAALTLLFAQIAPQEKPLMGLGGGLLAGCLLGLVGVHLTRFESTAEGHFYVPNIYIGVAISVVFLARMAYQMSRIEAFSQQALDPHAARSPLTCFLFAMVAGYYIAFFAGVLIRSRHLIPPPNHA